MRRKPVTKQSSLWNWRDVRDSWNAIIRARGDRLPQVRKFPRILGRADALLAAIQATGNPARVAFDDPDAIVLIETIGGRAGMALLMRDDCRQHPRLATR